MLQAKFVYSLAFGLLLIGLTPPPISAQQISFYDDNGRATAYIDIDDSATIYLWAGKPVAYVQGSTGSAFHVWGFNGKHLGWFERGAIWDADGEAVCITKEAYPGIVQLSPLKGLKQLKPLKGLRELAPLKPLLTNRLSDTPCSLFLSLGTSD